MVTNYHVKEQPGSIVNETLKNGILMLKDISKESDSYADFKYISFISSLSSKVTSLRKFALFWKLGGNTPKSQRILTKITPSHSAYQRTLQKKFLGPIYKNVELLIFCQKTNHGCVFICLFVFFVFFFPRGLSYQPSGPRVLQEGSF